MIRHVVLMKLKPETTDEQRSECLRRMKALPGQIPFALQHEAGMNMLHEETSWDLVQLFVLASREQIFEFRTHPAHLEASQYVAQFVEQMAGVDCEYEGI